MRSFWQFWFNFTRDVFNDTDGRISSRNYEASEDEIEVEKELCKNFIPNRAGRIAKSLVQLPKTKEIQRVRNVYSLSVVSLE